MGQQVNSDKAVPGHCEPTPGIEEFGDKISSVLEREGFPMGMLQEALAEARIWLDLDDHQITSKGDRRNRESAEIVEAIWQHGMDIVKKVHKKTGGDSNALAIAMEYAKSNPWPGDPERGQQAFIEMAANAEMRKVLDAGQPEVSHGRHR